MEEGCIRSAGSSSRARRNGRRIGQLGTVAFILLAVLGLELPCYVRGSCICSIYGTVRDSKTGKGIGGARIWTTWEEMGYTWETHSYPEGVYLIDMMCFSSPGQFTATAEGYFPQVVEVAECTAPPGEDSFAPHFRDVEFSLLPIRWTSFDGKVVDAMTGKPIAGANINFVLGQPEHPGYAKTANIQTDSLGYYDIDLPPGSGYRLTVTAGGYKSQQREYMVVDADRNYTDNWTLGEDVFRPPVSEKLPAVREAIARPVAPGSGVPPAAPPPIHRDIPPPQRTPSPMPLPKVDNTLSKEVRQESPIGRRTPISTAIPKAEDTLSEEVRQESPIGRRTPISTAIPKTDNTLSKEVRQESPIGQSAPVPTAIPKADNTLSKEVRQDSPIGRRTPISTAIPKVDSTASKEVQTLPEARPDFVPIAEISQRPDGTSVITIGIRNAGTTGIPSSFYKDRRPFFEVNCTPAGGQKKGPNIAVNKSFTLQEVDPQHALEKAGGLAKVDASQWLPSGTRQSTLHIVLKVNMNDFAGEQGKTNNVLVKDLTCR